MNKKNIDRLVSEALAIEAEEAKEAGAIGYMARALTMATMPHKNTPGCEFVRRNGAYEMAMMAPSKTGLPYGSMPRLLVAWVTTEAVRSKQREIEMGHNLSEFMGKLDIVPTGGRWGSITRLKDQMRRLFSSSITCTYEGDNGFALQAVRVVDKANVWWDPKNPDQAALFRSTLKLGEEFFNEVVERPVPIDMRALKALRGSPMALDIYCWSTHRVSYMRRNTVIPWEALQAQFGAEYGRTRAFKEAFLKHLGKVSAVYSGLKVEEQDSGLLMKPSKPHIRLIKP